MGSLLRDVRIGFRSLMKRPAFSLVAILTLALGIGANSAIFSFVKKVFFEPLPYRQPEQLVMVWQDYRDRGGPEREWFSYGNYLDYRKQSKSLADLAVYDDATFIVTGNGEPVAVLGQFVTPSVFEMLGVRFAQGRGFLPEEGRHGGPGVAVLGYELWQRRYGGDPGIVGKSVVVDDEPHTVVGVLPADFYFPLAPQSQLFTTLRPDPDMQRDRSDLSLRAVGRLRPGVSLAQARADLNAVAARIISDNPNADRRVKAAVYSLRDETLGPVRLALLVLAATVGFVLLIACANVANLLLARATTRRGEIGIRTAMGASSGRLVRQLMTESVLLSLLGGALAVALAVGSVEILKRLGAAASFPLPRIEAVSVDGSVLGFTLLVAIATGLLFGLAPALLVRHTNVSQVLQEGSSATVGRSSGRHAGHLLVVSEIALAMLLVVGSGLTLHSLRQLAAVDTGYDSRGVLAFRMQAPATRYPMNHQVTDFYDRLLARLRQLPGVSSVAAVSTLPLADNRTDFALAIEGRPVVEVRQSYTFWYRAASPSYFKTARLPILRGRGIEEGDQAGKPTVAVINETAARKYFPGEDPVGHVLKSVHFKITIVGVVANARTIELTRDEEPALYLSLPQMPARFMGVMVRTDGDPAALAQPVLAILHELDPSAAAINLRPLQEVVSASVAPARALGSLMAAFGVLALTLAAVGIYGLMSWLASERRKEIGIRMAIGADGGSIRRMVLHQTLVLGISGILLGLAASVVLTRLLAGVLFEVGALDPLSFAGSVAVIAAVAFTAGYLPAWRASRLDPAAVLRG